METENINADTETETDLDTGSRKRRPRLEAPYQDRRGHVHIPKYVLQDNQQSDMLEPQKTVVKTRW